MKKRGQANIISVVLIILLVLVAIIIVWNVVKRTIATGTEGMGISALTTNLEIQDAKLWVTGGAEIKVKRGAGAGEINSLKFIFEKSDGESEIVTRKAPAYEMPDELETKIYDFTPNELNEKIEKVSIAPIFGNNAGIQVYEPESKIEKDENGERILDAPDGLVSWYRFDGDVRDSVGGNHGTGYGGVNLNYDDAIRKKVASFDGVNDYVEIPDSPTWKSESLTAVLWLFPKGWVDLNTGSAPHHLYPYGDGFGIVTDSTIWGIWIRTSAGRQYRFISHNNQLNTWHHLVLAYDKTSGDMKFYWNGTLKGSYNLGAGTSINWSVGNLRVGYGPNYATNGAIDDVMIFNKALTEAEIQAVYNNQK